MRKTMARTMAVGVLSMPLGMAAGILTARFLGPSDRGLLTLLLLFPRTVTTMGNVGVDTASIYQHRRENVSIGTLFWNGVLYTIALSLVSGGILWHWRKAILGTLVSQSNPLYILIPALTVPFLYLVQLNGALARARGDFSSYNRRTLLEKVLTVVGLGLTFAVFTGTVVQCLIIFLAIPAVVSAWFVWDLRPYMRRGGPDFTVFRRTLAFGVKSYFQNVSSHIHNRADLYLIALYLNNAELAFYSIGASLAERILMVPDALGMILYPRLAGSTPAEGARLTARAARNTVLFGVVSSIPVLMLGRWMIELLYGKAFLPAAVPMYILAFGVLFIGVTRILLRFMTSINKHHYNAYIVLGSAALNVLLNFLLIPRFGINGAAVSSLLTYTLQSVMALAVFRALAGLNVAECIVPTRADVQHLFQIGRDFSFRGLRRAADSPSQA
jgi:O-antigen/teichoic acid export membrane protein